VLLLGVLLKNVELTESFVFPSVDHHGDGRGCVHLRADGCATRSAVRVRVPLRAAVFVLASLAMTGLSTFTRPKTTGMWLGLLRQACGVLRVALALPRNGRERCKREGAMRAKQAAKGA
jgi:hypothetical protein